MFGSLRRSERPVKDSQSTPDSTPAAKDAEPTSDSPPGSSAAAKDSQPTSDSPPAASAATKDAEPTSDSPSDSTPAAKDAKPAADSPPAASAAAKDAEPAAASAAAAKVAESAAASPAGSMCTVGVDLSASEARTASAAIQWGPDTATVAEPVVGLDDAELLGRLASADWIGIEAPFGWPGGMVDAVHSYSTAGEWSGIDKDAFCYRRTELVVHETILAETGKKMWPLSVSADRAALTAWRTAQLRERAFQDWGLRFDRAGANRVLEVYPIAALLLWDLEHTGYKAGKGAPEEAGVLAREALLEAIEAQAPWLAWEAGARDACLQCADALDAVLAALIARAGALGLTAQPEAEDLEQARNEGWIHLPSKGSLPDLCGAAEEVADTSSSGLAPALAASSPQPTAV